MSSTKKILYVDDEPINVLIFKKLMSKKYEVVTAADADEGLEVLSAQDDIDFVVSDMRMPGKNGLEFIQEAKENHPHLKYFILTGYSINQELQDALDNALIVQCWTKPANFELIDGVLSGL